jgi:hypothetical protein
VFNGKYSDQVGGLVLVDATQEDQYRLLPRAWSNLGVATLRRAERQAFWAPLYINLGIAHLQLRLQGQQVPPVILQSKYLKARTSEFENIEVSAEQARTADHIGDKPLVMLTASKVIDAPDAIVTAVRELCAQQNQPQPEFRRDTAATSKGRATRPTPGYGWSAPDAYGDSP